MTEPDPTLRGELQTQDVDERTLRPQSLDEFIGQPEVRGALMSGSGATVFAVLRAGRAGETVAERAGLELPATEAMSTPQASRAVDRRRVIAALAAADTFYRRQLEGDGGKRAREFLVERGFDDDVVAHFGLGFAPDSWDAVQQHLTKHDFSEEELEIAGLVKRRDTGKGTYDRLRDRVVFPIRDLRGQTIAFGGRVIDQGEPKYLNSPETPTFNKGRTLYGLGEARDAIGERGFALLVEGYFDLLACAQYGVRNAVAPLGTAFTEDHAKLLARFTRKAVIGFDGDTAGQSAAERTVGIFLGQGFQVNVVRLPTGHDPDSYLQAEGIDGFRAACKSSDSGLEFIIRRAGERHDLGTPHGKAGNVQRELQIEVLLRLVAAHAPRRILDLGCGMGDIDALLLALAGVERVIQIRPDNVGNVLFPGVVQLDGSFAGYGKIPAPLEFFGGGQGLLIDTGMKKSIGLR